MATRRARPPLAAALGALLLAAALPAQHADEDARPDLDLALREATLVVLARPAGTDRAAVVEILAGATGDEVLTLFQPRSYCFHQRFPAEGPVRLLCLVRRAQGWVPLQRPGLMPVVAPDGAEAEGLRSLCALIRRMHAHGPREAARDGAARINAALAAELGAWVGRWRTRLPVQAEAALLALARRPDLARHLEATGRATLASTLEDARSPEGLRDLSARALVAAADPEVGARLLALLRDDAAGGLAPVFGRLLRQVDPEHAAARLAEVFERGGPKAREAAVTALAATSDPRARAVLKRLATRDDLTPTLRHRLRDR
ncbi:MAG: hypothetical protein R3F30_02115 [Planctomycetota bacterium]